MRDALARGADKAVLLTTDEWVYDGAAAAQTLATYLAAYLVPYLAPYHGWEPTPPPHGASMMPCTADGINSASQSPYEFIGLAKAMHSEGLRNL